jgi:hypothetical protein
MDNEEAIRAWLKDCIGHQPKKNLSNLNVPIPQRMWNYLLQRSGIEVDQKGADLKKKSFNRLVEHLYRDRYEVKGKTTFKEEFVTAGGVDLGDIEPNSLQSKVVPGLYFAGEVLDIDGITGGYNFQAAWSTGFVAGQLK